eukprot:GHVU01138846.1.p1 GENE.GHVU01138846.1~~GHVU01138846.1.p1  ORF type:complete len:269 (+),score=39.95 GHVU01138846.1:24-830(+)
MTLKEKESPAAAPGESPAYRMDLPKNDEIARKEGDFCVDELCQCTHHRCPPIYEVVPFEGSTAYRESYNPKELPPRTPMLRPQLPESLPFEGTTAYRDQFGAKEMPERRYNPAAPYERPAEDRCFATEARTQFSAKELPPRPAVQRAVAPEPLPFEGSTAYREQFVPKEIAARPPASKPIHPESLPFEGSTAYREQFGAPELPARVPPALQKFECVPDDRDFGTAYRTQYPGHRVEICQVRKLPAYPTVQVKDGRKHMFWDRTNRKWY